MSFTGIIRRNASNRAADKIRVIQDQFIMSQVQSPDFQVTDSDFTNKSVNLRSKIKIIDYEDSSKVAVTGPNFYPTYIPTEEPNGSTVVLYHFFDYLVETYKDFSGYGNDATLNTLNSVSATVPFPVIDRDGPDLGRGYPSNSIKLSGYGPSCQVLVIPDDATLRLAGLTVGFTMVIRFRMASITPDTGEYRRIYSKRDDASNYFLIAVDSSGILHFHVQRAGVTTKWKTTTPSVVLNTFHLLTFTYAITGPALVVEVDDVSKAVTTDTDIIQVNASNFSLILGGWGITGEKGSINGNIQFIFIVRDVLYTATDFTNINTNEWTKQNIAFGRVAMLGSSVYIT
jgi:hypothetical protein